MLRKTLQLASETLLPTIVGAAVLKNSVPSLDPVIKANHIRIVINREGLTWFIDELLASLIHYILVSDCYRPADILKKPELPDILMASVAARTAVGASYSEDLEKIADNSLATRRSLSEVLDLIRLAVPDPFEYLIVTSRYVLNQRHRALKNKYGLERKQVESILEANDLRIEAALLG